ncbi:MAG: MAPEG family protein [Pseudomonadota bacterium]
MSATASALIYLALWPLVLLTILIVLRVGLTLTGKKAANTFSPTGEDVSPFSQRLTRAHANNVEHVPFILVIMLYAIVSNQTAITDGLAFIMLFARIGQSVVHLISTSVPMVLARAGLLGVQLAIVFYWAFSLIAA